MQKVVRHAVANPLFVRYINIFSGAEWEEHSCLVTHYEDKVRNNYVTLVDNIKDYL